MTKSALKIGGCILAEKPKRYRTDSKPYRPLMRRIEIEKLIRARHGAMVPDPEDTDDRATCLAYARAAALSLSGQDMHAWAARWMPWADRDEIQPFIAEAAKRRHMMSADGVAGMLMVTYAERSQVGLNTIGACDISKDQRLAFTKAKKRERDRLRQEQIRSNRKAKDRKSYEAESLSSLKPWDAEGISRPTWYRRQQRETGASRVDSIPMDGDTHVSPIEIGGQPVPTSSKPRTSGAAGRWGLGTESPSGLQGAEPHGSGDTWSEEAA